MVQVINKAKKSPPDEHNSKAFPLGVGDGMGVKLRRAVGEAAGRGLLVLVLELVLVGATGSVPVMDTKPSRTRA